MANISTNYMGLKLKSPVIAASSGLTSKIDKIEELEKVGVGAVVLKSLFEEQIVNNAEYLDSLSTDFPESANYIHYYVRENSIENHLTLLKEAKKRVSIPVIASINCYSPGEWLDYAREVSAAGADALELNIYSMPLNIRESSSDIEQRYLKIVGEVTKNISIPVAVKISSDFTNLPGFTDKLKGYGAKGVVMFNKFYMPDIDIEKLEISSADPFSSKESYLKELRWIGIISALVPGIDISASTGIYSAEIAAKEILAGAATVQVCSALYKNGTKVIDEINSGIASFIEQMGFGSVADFRGKLNYSNISDPGKFERVQFMKSFGSK
jgi:Dihydroorotate dehydrogenase